MNHNRLDSQDPWRRPDDGREEMGRRPWPLAALVMLIVIVSGCGSGSAGTVSSPGNSTSASHGSSATARTRAVKFAECMRANGLSAFPDPNASGAFTIEQAVNGSGLDPNSSAFKRAISACKNLEPPGFTGGTVTPSQRTARLEFAQCVRDNGVPDFPDPTPNGPLVDTTRIPSAATPAGKSILRAAMQKCRNFASAAGVTRGS